jgi:predicted transcriptional regulator of viral defense system
MILIQVMEMNKTERLYAYVLCRRVVTSDELGEWAREELGKDYKYLYTKYITRLLAQGKLVRVTRGMYAARNLFPTDPHDHPDALPNKYLVGSKLRGRYYLGYHTALELNGCAYSSTNSCFVVTLGPDRFRPFHHGPLSFESIVGRDVTTEIVIETIAGTEVMTSSPSRTFVECTRRLDLCGGLEEVLKSIDGLRGVTGRGLKASLEIYGYDILYRSVGFFLELMKEESSNYEFVTDELLDFLRSRSTGSTAYLVDGVPSRLEDGWNLYVPVDLDKLMAGV